MLFKKAAVLSLMFLSLFIIVSFAGDDAFNYSKKIVLNTTSSGASVSEEIKNLPVLIKLDESNFDFSEISDDLVGDINFTFSKGSFLSYRVKNWDKANKILEVWIIVPIVYGNNKNQYVTMSWSKKSETFEKQKIKDRVDLKKSRETEEAFDLDNSSSVFKKSYNLYGVWTSNDTNGFSIIGGK